MGVPKRFKSIEAIQENSINDVIEMVTAVEFVHYRQIKEGVRSFEKVKDLEISILEVAKLLEDIQKNDYILNQRFGPDRVVPENEAGILEGLILIAKDPEVWERVTELIMIEGINGNFRFIVKTKYYGQRYTWEIIEQVSRAGVEEKELERVVV